MRSPFSNENEKNTKNVSSPNSLHIFRNNQNPSFTKKYFCLISNKKPKISQNLSQFPEFEKYRKNATRAFSMYKQILFLRKTFFCTRKVFRLFRIVFKEEFLESGAGDFCLKFKFETREIQKKVKSNFNAN